LGFAEGLALSVGVKPNVPLVRLAKIVLKKMRGGKKSKTSGRLECRFTPCLYVLYSVCFSHVKIVYFFRLTVSLLIVAVSVVILACNILGNTSYSIYFKSKINLSSSNIQII
jgi:hypothetical protein